jgi:putative membrane protein
MRYVKWLFLAVLGICLITVGFANHQPVTLTLLPSELAAFVLWNGKMTVPLYAAIFGGLVAGLIIGFFWEWLREYKHRSEAVTNRRDKVWLEAELRKLKAEKNEHDDDVLALLENTGPTR